MSELFEVDIENYNLIQLARWIRSFRTYIQISDKPLYSQYPYAYQEKVSGFCNEYKYFYNSHKKALSSKDFDKALKLSVLKTPRYIAVTSDNVEIDITEEIEQLQLENTVCNVITKSIDREADRSRKYAGQVESFKLGEREALYDIIQVLSANTITYKINILEKSEQIDKLDIKRVLQEIRRGKWQTIERELKPANNLSLSDYLFAEMRKNHINKNIFYPFTKNKEKDKQRIYGKQFLCNVGFYIGLNAEEMEQVLRNEGFTIRRSKRLDDRILFECFYYSFSREYASALLKMSGYEGLEIGK